MALPATYDLTGARAIYCGDTYQMNLTLRSQVSNPDDPTGPLIPGDPLDLTGCEVLAQVRPGRRGTGDTPAIAFDVVNADSLDDTGVINLVMPPSKTTTLAVDNPKLIGVWDLQITWPSPDDDVDGEPLVRTYLAGNVAMVKDVSYE